MNLSINKKFILFGFVGIIGVVINLGSLAILKSYGVNLYIAFYISYLIAAITGYLLNASYVFNHAHTLYAFLRFLTVAVFMSLVNAIIASWFNYIVENEFISQTSSVLLLYPLSYFLQRKVTFRIKRDKS